MKIVLSKPLASDGGAEAYDVVQVKKALNRLGYYVPYEKIGITGIPDRRMFDAIKSFQRMNNLRPSGQLRPEDETVKAMNRALSEPKEGYYTWRTVEDGKVRKAHAQYNRTIRDWSDSPDPGEDFNCRCWAEPVKEGYFLPERGLNTAEILPVYDPFSEIPLDGINPAISPLDFIGGGIFSMGARSLSARLLTSRLRDTTWIVEAPVSQIQHSFSRAFLFGVRGNYNKTTLAQFRKSLINHIKSADTIVIKGTYHKKPIIHYLNPKNGLHVMRKTDGEFLAAWKLSEKQIVHVLKNGKLGGNKK